MVQEQNLVATSILDFDTTEVRAMARRLRPLHAEDQDYLRACHAEIIRRVSPIYTVNEWQPASITLRKAQGSCSQRLALLEALARAAGIPTQVRVLWVSGRFWYPRFSAFFRLFIPRRVLLLWPQFWVRHQWIGVEEIHSPLQHLASGSTLGFTNNGETLFEAVSHIPVDFAGLTCGACGDRYDLSRFIVSVEETAPTRDAALSRYRLFQGTTRGRAFELLLGGRASC